MIEDDDDDDNTLSFFKIDYASFQKSKNAVYANAKVKNYEVAIKRSQIDKFTRKIRKCDLVCDKSIIYKTRLSKSQRDNNFVKIDCL